MVSKPEWECYILRPRIYSKALSSPRDRNSAGREEDGTSQREKNGSTILTLARCGAQRSARAPFREPLFRLCKALVHPQAWDSRHITSLGLVILNTSDANRRNQTNPAVGFVWYYQAKPNLVSEKADRNNTSPDRVRSYDLSVLSDGYGYLRDDYSVLRKQFGKPNHQTHSRGFAWFD